MIATPTTPSGRRDQPPREAAASEAQPPAPAPQVGRGRRRRRSCPDPRVEPAVDEVGGEVRQHDRDRQDQEDALEDRVVAGLEGLLGQRPEPGQLNTTSTVIAPAMMKPRLMPMSDTVGSRAFGTA